MTIALKIGSDSTERHQQQRVQLLDRFQSAVSREYYQAETEVDLPDGESELQISRASAGPLAILRYTSPGRTRARRDWKHIRSDGANFYVVWFVDHGQLTITQHSRSTTVASGAFAISSAGAPLTISSTADESGCHRSWQLIVPPHLMRGLLADVERVCACAFPLRPAARLALEVFELLFKGAGSTPTMLCERLAREVFEGMLRELAEDGDAGRISRADDEWRQVATTYMVRHLSEHGLSADRVAKAVGISASYLRRLFATDHSSFRDYLWEQRLLRANELLTGGKLPVGEVAGLVGFRSAAHFSRAFRQRFSSSPREIRKRAAGKWAHES